ncbi:MAG: hypothetical protein COA58_10085 [Bacteroidetes bacterium]|nr:MAG: hypothetical protein COA58_10085 [Bacteroidota bacterium]
MSKTGTLLIAFCLLSFSSLAQNASVSGKLLDDKGNGVPYASIALSSSLDTSTLQFSVALEDGSFSMKNIEEGSYIIVVACVGYEVEHKPILVDRNLVNWNISMTPSAMSMKEVMVKAKKIPIFMNGDTVVYNSSSFKTSANATVEDLMKKLPGVRVAKDGTVTAEGEQVTKILINGKEFFGGNVEAATKNLDADLVDKIEVINKKTDEDEFTEGEGNQTEKVINLVLKEEHAKGYFGNIRAGYGTDNVQNFHGNLNFFRDATQLSIIGGANNISKRLYGWRDMQTLNSFSINPMNSWNTFYSRNSGVSTNKGIGTNLHFEPLKNLKADISYIVTDVETIDTGLYNSEVYLTNNTLFGESKSNSLIQDKNHKINSKIEYEPDTLNRIVARFQYEVLANSQDYISRVINYNSTSENILNSGVTKDASGKDNSKLASKIHWTKKNRKNIKNHFLGSIYYGSSSVKNDKGSYFKSVNNILLPVPQNELPIVKTALESDEVTFATTAAYQFEVNKKFSIRPGVNWLGSEYDHKFEWNNNNEVIKTNSPNGNVRYDNVEYYTHFIFKIDSFTTLRVVPEVNQMIEQRRFVTDTVHEYSYNQLYFIPFVFIQSRKNHKYNLYAHLRANVQRPQTNQLLPVVDNTNPYNTIIGNIELENSIRYSAYMNYRKMLGLGKYIAYNTWSNYTLNPVISRVTVDEFNYSVRELQNYKYSASSSHSLSFNWPVQTLKTSIELDASYNFNKSFLIQNNKEIESVNQGFKTGVELQWNEFDKWSLGLGYGVGLNEGKIGGITNNSFVSQDMWAELVVSPIDRFEWSTELDVEVYGANAAAGAQTIPIISSEISYYLDSNQRWSIGAKAYDILDQNQNIWRNWSSNRFVQSQNLAIQRYFMATVRYKIKKAPKKKPGKGLVDKRG